MDARTAWLALVGQAALDYRNDTGECLFCDAASQPHREGCILGTEPTVGDPVAVGPRAEAIGRAHLVVTAAGFHPVCWMRASDSVIVDEVRDNEPRWDVLNLRTNGDFKSVSTDELAETIKAPR